MMENAAEIRGVGKEYKVYPSPFHRVREWLSPRRSKHHQSIWALRDINFDLPPGATFGLIGENGAGKSTLLKILSGTTFPTTGDFRLKGKVASLLELGAGFHSSFSGLENIYMNAAMLGFSRRDIRDKLNEIVEFSGLGDFIYSPIRTYSSGMVCRLGFSMAIAVEPDIMIIDEILAVGDMEFQKKCVDKIWRLKNDGRTIIFCSHSLADVRQICDKVAWIKDGRIHSIGEAVAITNEYANYEKELMSKREQSRESLPPETAEIQAGAARIDKASLVVPGTSEPRHQVNTGDTIEVLADFINQDPPVDLCVGIGFSRVDATLCFANSTEMDGIMIKGRSGQARLTIPNLSLLAGTYTVFVWLMDGKGIHRYHQFLCDRDLVVADPNQGFGLYTQDHTWSLEQTS